MHQRKGGKLEKHDMLIEHENPSQKHLKAVLFKIPNTCRLIYLSLFHRSLQHLAAKPEDLTVETQSHRTWDHF